MAKRIVVGVLVLVVFGIVLSWLGRLDVVVNVAREVLPEPAPVPPAPIVAEPSVIDPLIEQGLVDGDTLLIRGDEVVAVLDSIPLTSSRPAADYERELFGKGWKDPDRNGCDARNDTLARDLSDVVFRPGTNDCVVIAGSLIDPYTGQTVAFTKESAQEVPIDHVVALSWAWQNGASSWDAERLIAFANDPANLTATQRSVNSAKSDKGPGDWQPQSPHSCAYVTRWVSVVAAYGLTVAESDRNAARRTLASC